jgi:hypothetical protein
MKIPTQSLGVNRYRQPTGVMPGTIFPSRQISRSEFRSACNSCGLTHCDGCCEYSFENGTCTCDCANDTGRGYCTEADAERAAGCVGDTVDGIEKVPAGVTVFEVQPRDPRRNPVAYPLPTFAAEGSVTQPAVPGRTGPVFGRTLFG